PPTRPEPTDFPEEADMPILDRASLEQSPLADLHAIASELSIDGYRRLRKPELIDLILERQGGEEASAAPEAEPEDDEPKARPRRRGRRRRTAGAEPEAADEAAPEEAAAPEADESPAEAERRDDVV